MGRVSFSWPSGYPQRESFSKAKIHSGKFCGRFFCCFLLCCSLNKETLKVKISLTWTANLQSGHETSICRVRYQLTGRQISSSPWLIPSSCFLRLTEATGKLGKVQEMGEPRICPWNWMRAKQPETRSSVCCPDQKMNVASGRNNVTQGSISIQIHANDCQTTCLRPKRKILHSVCRGQRPRFNTWPIEFAAYFWVIQISKATPCFLEVSCNQTYERNKLLCVELNLSWPLACCQGVGWTRKVSPIKAWKRVHGVIFPGTHFSILFWHFRVQGVNLKNLAWPNIVSTPLSHKARPSDNGHCSHSPQRARWSSIKQ